ncbi:hypothetical protein [Aeromicrobium marinum]|nr:hypothetical protein [Aeromicrobium marinum]
MSDMRYGLMLPSPWQHVPLGRGRRERIAEIVDEALARLPDDAPPDQVAQGRIKLTEMLETRLRAAVETGAVDFYLPTALTRGVDVRSSFLVNEVLPDASAPEGVTGQVLARLLADDGAKPVTAGHTVWVRTEEVVDRAADETVSDDVSVRKVEYTTALPADERYWYVVTFTTFGHEHPRDGLADAMVELFDAIMSTWRWLEAA